MTKITEKVDNYYTEKITQHGISAKGVDWKNEDVQELRFSQIFKLFESDLNASIIDLGCGYGGFLRYLRDRGFSGHYLGLDLSDKMIESAKDYCKDDTNSAFHAQNIEASDIKADYVVASGIFNVRIDTEKDVWKEYVFNTIESMDKASIKGFSFNCLSTYVDYTEDKLFYLNPMEVFDLCKKEYAKNVAILHDYGLYEFTIIVRKKVV
jgi:SAM-dependent methyltransferase